MPPRSLRDEWLIPTLESLLSKEQVAERLAALIAEKLKTVMV